MKPWPEALRKLCPLSPVPWEERGRREYPRVVGARPWWMFPEIVKGSPDSIRDDKRVGWRRDGTTIWQRGKRQLFTQGPGSSGLSWAEVPKDGSWQGERVNLATLVDTTNPLPHPGFRAGQVWADETGTTVVVTRMTQGIPWFENGRGSGYIRDYPYLVADLCCPHLAPWSPSGEKNE